MWRNQHDRCAIRGAARQGNFTAALDVMNDIRSNPRYRCKPRIPRGVAKLHFARVTVWQCKHRAYTTAGAPSYPHWAEARIVNPYLFAIVLPLPALCQAGLSHFEASKTRDAASLSILPRQSWRRPHERNQGESKMHLVHRNTGQAV